MGGKKGARATPCCLCSKDDRQGKGDFFLCDGCKSGAHGRCLEEAGARQPSSSPDVPWFCTQCERQPTPRACVLKVLMEPGKPLVNSEVIELVAKRFGVKIRDSLKKVMHATRSSSHHCFELAWMHGGVSKAWYAILTNSEPAVGKKMQEAARARIEAWETGEPLPGQDHLVSKKKAKQQAQQGAQHAQRQGGKKAAAQGGSSGAAAEEEEEPGSGGGGSNSDAKEAAAEPLRSGGRGGRGKKRGGASGGGVAGRGGKRPAPPEPAPEEEQEAPPPATKRQRSVRQQQQQQQKGKQTSEGRAQPSGAGQQQQEQEEAAKEMAVEGPSSEEQPAAEAAAPAAHGSLADDDPFGEEANEAEHRWESELAAAGAAAAAQAARQQAQQPAELASPGALADAEALAAKAARLQAIRALLRQSKTQGQVQAGLSMSQQQQAHLARQLSQRSSQEQWAMHGGASVDLAQHVQHAALGGMLTAADFSGSSTFPLCSPTALQHLAPAGSGFGAPAGAVSGVLRTYMQLSASGHLAAAQQQQQQPCAGGGAAAAGVPPLPPRAPEACLPLEARTSAVQHLHPAPGSAPAAAVVCAGNPVVSPRAGGGVPGTMGAAEKAGSGHSEAGTIPTQAAVAATAGAACTSGGAPQTSGDVLAVYDSVSALVLQQEGALGEEAACRYLLQFTRLSWEQQLCHLRALQGFARDGRGGMFAHWVSAALEAPPAGKPAAELPTHKAEPPAAVAESAAAADAAETGAAAVDAAAAAAPAERSAAANPRPPSAAAGAAAPAAGEAHLAAELAAAAVAAALGVQPKQEPVAAA